MELAIFKACLEILALVAGKLLMPVLAAGSTPARGISLVEEELEAFLLSVLA